MSDPDWPAQLNRLECNGTSCIFTMHRLFCERALYAHRYQGESDMQLPHAVQHMMHTDPSRGALEGDELLHLHGYPSASRGNENPRTGRHIHPNQYPHNGSERSTAYRRKL